MSKYLIAMDSETGGLDPKDSDILTLYIAVVDENLKIVDELDLKLKPDNGIPPRAAAGALEKNGINLDQHMKDPETISYSKAAEKITLMLKKYLKKVGRYSNLSIMGYNVRFDVNFLQEHLIPKKELEKLVHYKVVDTMDAIDFLKRNDWIPPSIGTLESAVSYFQVPKGKAHTAKDDVLMTIEVEKKISELMASKKNGGQGIDLIALLESE